jgi:ankyrin repeat protein
MVSQNVLTAPIIGAARNNKKEIVEILLKAGADPNVAIIEADGWESVQNDFTALTAASQTGNEYIVKLLLSAGKIKKSKGSNLALLVASCGGYKDILEELLKAGVADIDYENVLMSLSDTHHTSLTCAAEKGHKKVVETLLKFGANPNKVVLITGNDYSPSTAYSQAANEAIKDILLKAGAEPDIRKFLLIEAVTTGDKDDVKEMLRPFWKADLTARDKDGNTALDLAIKRGDTEIIEMLKEAGAKE